MLTGPPEDFDLPAYLAHIGFAGDPAPDLPTLRAVCRLHPQAIPFENLTPLSGATVELDIESLQAKMIGRRRGGYCYEQNTLLAHALAAIGFATEGLAGRVMLGRAETERPALTHMTLRVRVGDADFLADAGFGGFTPTAPLHFAPDIAQQTPHETFRFTLHGGHLMLEVQTGGQWRPLFLLDTGPRFAADYAIANYWISTHPDSQFTRRLIVSRPFAGGRRTMNNLRLSEYRAGAAPESRVLASADELESVLDEMFGIDIPDPDALRRAVAHFPAESD